MRSAPAVSCWASKCASTLLSRMGDGWLHVQAAAEKARRLGELLAPNDRDDLLAAAYLHDIGYTPTLVQTGFHPLDGARYRRVIGYERLGSLVAYHSEARF